MARENDGDLYYRQKGSYRFNVRFKAGVIESHVTAKWMIGCRPEDIDFVWIIEEARKANPEEVEQL